MDMTYKGDQEGKQVEKNVELTRDERIEKYLSSFDNCDINSTDQSTINYFRSDACRESFKKVLTKFI